jgi:hypothetical protein
MQRISSLSPEHAAARPRQAPFRAPSVKHRKQLNVNKTFPYEARNLEMVFIPYFPRASLRRKFAVANESAKLASAC